ncbi:MAG: hypothetical protein KAW09_08505, partial [Thermoplasmata archaeon]|nr:hypothetical protein [Thermoplasmata archaeon]
MAILISLAIGSVAIKPEDPVNNLTFGPNVRVDDTGFQLSDQVYPDIAVDNMGVIYVVWYDDRNFISAYHDIYLAKSSNGGISYDTNIQVDDGGQFTTQMNPSVAADKSGAVYVAWQDYRNGNWDIYLAKSIDRGLSFGPSARVDDTGNDSSNQAIPSVEVARNGTVFVVWHDHGSNSIRLSRSLDGGAIFEPSVLVNDPIGSPALTVPSLTVDAQGNIFVSWSGNRDGFYHVYLSKSTDGGLSFDPDLQVDDASDGGRSGSWIRTDSAGNIYAVWMDSRNVSNGIYFAKSTDGGSTFEKNVRVDNIGTGAVIASDPSLGVDSVGNVYVTWDDNRNNNQRDIFFASSLDGGLSFGSDIRVDDTGSTVSGQWSPSIAIFENNSTSHVFITWFDKRNGNWDIYSTSTNIPHPLPDLVVEKRDLTINPPAVAVGSSARIKAIISNHGDFNSTNVTVRFFEGDPVMGNQIGVDCIIPYIAKQENVTVEATWTASALGTYEIFVVADPDDIIREYNETNNTASQSIMVYQEIPSPSNLTANVVGEDIRLNWTAPENATLSHHLIYRAESQIAFDFDSPIHNTSGDPDPRATDWTDDDMCSDVAPRELYYIVRAVGVEGTMSATSNTAGKWTVVFDSGLNSLSLPLEPHMNRNVSWFAGDIPNATFIRWMDPAGHWITHHKGMGEGVSDTSVRMGRGYEIALTSLTTYTFTGYPGSMIRFQGGLGDSVTFRKSLSVSIEGNDVNLSWDAPAGTDRYLVFRSDERDGLHDLSLSPIANTTETYWRDAGIIGNQKSEYYYMVIPLDSASGMGSSTYSVGVTTVVYGGGSDTFALPLRPMDNHTLDLYCDAIPDVAGMAYMISELWKYHGKEIPQGVYDVDVLQGEGYQISI